jgi:hypothetical protein
MAYVAATTTGLVIWVVLWATGFKAFDAFLLTAAIVLLTVVARTLMTHLPGRRQG